MKLVFTFLQFVGLLTSTSLLAQTNPLWHEQKIKNYLPHMTVPEVRELLNKTDMVIIPVAALEQHGLHLPIGTDFLNGVEEAKLIAQQTDVLVAPVLLAGQSPYHMGFPGTISISSETIVQVHLEAVKSLLQHGFKRFLILNAHAGNRATSSFLIDRINQETAGIAVDLSEGAAPFRQKSATPKSTVFDRHAGVGETSSALYLIPSLVNLPQAEKAKLTLPPHLQAMLPAVVAGDPTANLVFLAEGLKAKETGKKTSSAEMSTTGVWGIRDPKEATAAQGRAATENFVNAAVAFIQKWKELRPTK
ncbi:hypothetical protein AHMF7605_12390 [Adhaeribacter arboris]|uniref:Creatininase n=1 Tax=Adhaeribacter arboris TaxID=2072846 RepID=A0A2T2YFJ7_9BACT|nr:creatininase family protein [Adhaeribacter arboris]PSR54263.1 hypothetical protein AHMF7605_12390 [Adhaeribacter arboris]